MKTLPKLKTLPNGLRVLNVGYSGIDSATITIRGAAGSNYENEKQVGCAHLLEHAVFDGTKKYPSNFAIDSAVENVGGTSNARTSREQVEYYAKFLKEDIEVGFDVISQLVIDPLLNARTITREREIVRQEAIRKLSDPVDRFFQDRFRNFFPNQRVATPVIGDLTHIRNITSTNINEFFNQNYVAENFVLGVCGDLADDYVFDLAEKYFKQMPSGKKNNLISWNKNSKKEYFVRKHKDVSQATVVLSWFAPEYDTPEMYPTYFLASVLGQSFLSRLVSKLRTELGYAYAVSASYQPGLDYGLFGLFMQLGEKNFENAINVVKDEINVITKELISEEEYQRELKQILTSYVFYFEKPRNILSYYTNKTVQDLYPGLNHNQVLDKYREVKKEDILSIANTIFNSPPKIGVISKSISKKRVQNVL